MKGSPSRTARWVPADPTVGTSAGFDLRSAGLLFCTGGAVPLPLLALVDSSVLVPGGLPWMLGIWCYTVVSLLIVIWTRPVGDRTFLCLSTGGMAGIGCSSFLVAGSSSAYAILCLNAAIPALAAMQSRLRVVVAFQAGALLFVGAHIVADHSTVISALVPVGATSMAVVFPTVLVLGFRRSLERLLRVQIELGRIDPLTGVLNRRGLIDHASELLTSGRHVGILAIDIDNFKSVNDLHGHGHGDEVLVRTARRLSDLAGSGAVTARLGGEEFVIVIPVDTPEWVALVAERIRDAIASDGEVTVSIGAVAYRSTSPAGEDAKRRLTTATLFDELVLSADRRMYAAKQAGRNRVIADCVLERP